MTDSTQVPFLSELPRMRHKSVTGSTVVESLSYDRVTRELRVTFVTYGKVYSYVGVPEEVYDELVKAPSVGKYLHAHIIKGAYKATLVDILR